MYCTVYTKICKNCFEELDSEEQYIVVCNMEEDEVERDTELEFSDNEDLISQQSNSDCNVRLDEDLFNDYLTSSQEPDLSEDEDDSLKYEYDQSNSGECMLNVREDNKNRGVYKDITVSGSTIMNQ